MLQHDDAGRPRDTQTSGSLAQLCRHVGVGVAGANLVVPDHRNLWGSRGEKR